MAFIFGIVTVILMLSNDSTWRLTAVACLICALAGC